MVDMTQEAVSGINCSLLTLVMITFKVPLAVILFIPEPLLNLQSNLSYPAPWD